MICSCSSAAAAAAVAAADAFPFVNDNLASLVETSSVSLLHPLSSLHKEGKSRSREEQATPSMADLHDRQASISLAVLSGLSTI